MKTVRVLVAEDNDDHRFLTVRALRSVEGVEIQVEGVRDGEETLDFVYQRGQFAGQARPHLILLDLKMPRVNGLEVLDQLKRDPDLATIPVVVLSSSDQREDVEAAYRHGTNSYITKPTSTGGYREDLQCVATLWTARTALPEPPS
jgi:two-component system, chemotaxis family, response regulator Rcp1